MSREVVKWSSHWWPRAAKAGVIAVDGDYYFTGATKDKGSDTYYSEKFGAWIYRDYKDGGYELRRIGWKKGNTRDGVQADNVKLPDNQQPTQNSMHQEFVRLAKLGGKDEERKVENRVGIRFLLQIQQLTEQLNAQNTPVEDPEIEVLKQKVWDWLNAHVDDWNWTDEQKAEVKADFVEATGIEEPTEEVLVTVRVKRGMTGDTILQKLETLNESSTEIHFVEISK